jgi:Lrp/AsnC family leucine-responsive transcriptional regulator
MEEMGIITGATIHINYKSFGYKAVAYVLIKVDPRQADKLTEFLQKKPEVYSFNNRGVKGNIDVIVILKTIEQLNEVKDSIKRCFSILEMKTAIWTDVKEMNQNLEIIPTDFKDRTKTVNEIVPKIGKDCQNMILDDIDQKIADKLAEDGRISMINLGKELGVSAVTAKRRYQKLKENGILKVTIQIDPHKIGYQALCIFFTTTSSERLHLIIDKVSKIPNIISIMKTTGDFDLQIYAMVQDIGQLLYIQEQIGQISGVTKIDLEILGFGEEWKKWPSPRQYISTF